MIIAQAPLRICLFGDGSDLPAYLANSHGAVLSFAIDQRVFIVGHPFTHRHGILLKYSQSEDVARPGDLQHPIAREVLGRYGVSDIDIAVMSDVPAGTGLGSSSSFTVAFLAFVRHTCGIVSTPVDLAREACEIEVDVLGEPIGYQDQWASALGGVNLIRFCGQDVHVEPIGLGAAQIAALEANLHLVPVGTRRSASERLAPQGNGVSPCPDGVEVTSRLVGLVEHGRRALLGEMDHLGPLLDEGWWLKREVAKGGSNPEVDDLYARGLAAGGTGGKLLGVGGSAYLAFYVPAGEHDRFAAIFPKRLGFRVTRVGAGITHES